MIAPPPPKGARNCVVLILDSCRWDAMMEADPKFVHRLGQVEKRYSYATWTAPSHYNLLMGLLPHPSPKNVFASAHYKSDLNRFSTRLNVPNLCFEEMIPRLWLPHHLKWNLGYKTQAIMSLPTLNPATPIAVDFDRYEMAPKHNDLMAIVNNLEFDADRPNFIVINTGETHYPYAPSDEPENQWPTIHGIHGVFKTIAHGQPISTTSTPFFNLDRLQQLYRRQIRAIQSLEQAVTALYDKVPPNTWITITSDHGELFGEGGYFGHGPINHRKVLEVPFVEGLLR